MNISRLHCRKLYLVIICMLFATLRPVEARSQAQRQAPVEVTVPKAPIPVLGAGKRLLVYEVHITNFGSRPLTLRSVEVFAGQNVEVPLATLRDSSLRAAIQTVGLPQPSPAAAGD